ncbi:GTP-binding protein typa/bipa homolog [Phtheirospermum japonicum]|uniref:GTP-binding protein typa/bipa homolog n=1 Tax=Phtheirospermum japonicum TaxID=374723 RepID=A0A830B0N3_9LAMI|nr:GTP-binding protein typa/bipa homolog [Phtheirospermum japonicum]
MVGPLLRSLWSTAARKATSSSSSSNYPRPNAFSRVTGFSRSFSSTTAAATSPSTADSGLTAVDPSKLRNVAVIAHVDHGKTTLMDRLLRQCGADIPHERALDSISLERERGITIASKVSTGNDEKKAGLTAATIWSVTAISWNGNELNMVDTPGHADFGGEVERVVGMVEGAILVVDAGEGPLAQTKFVLAKALKYGLRPLLLLNKVDRPSVTEERCNEVESLVFDLFDNLGATEEQLEFPVLYASAKEGWASYTYTKNPPDDAKNMSQLLDAVVKHVHPPTASLDAPFQMLVSMMERDNYVGRILTGRINSGILHVGDRVHGLHSTDSGVVKLEEGKVVKLMKKRGTTIVSVDSAGAGDIVSMAGLTNPAIGHTIASVEVMTALPTVELDPPTISMTFGVNDSPLAGRDGTYLTGRQIGDRLMAEAERNLAINVLPSMSESYEVQGRGELQLGILIENMRREKFELSVSPPKVMYKVEKGQKLEPIEEVTVEVNEEHVGLVMEALSHRRGEVTDMGPVPGNVAYEKYRGPLGNVRKGVLVSMGYGTVTAHALMSLEARGILFVKPGMEAYDGMIIGEHSRDSDLDVNPVRTKELTNVRAACKDENVKLTPPRLAGYRSCSTSPDKLTYPASIPVLDGSEPENPKLIKDSDMTLEEAIGYVASDELIEVTPSAIRLRKRYLDFNKRKTMSKKPKE